MWGRRRGQDENVSELDGEIDLGVCRYGRESSAITTYTTFDPDEPP